MTLRELYRRFNEPTEEEFLQDVKATHRIEKAFNRAYRRLFEEKNGAPPHA